MISRCILYILLNDNLYAPTEWWKNKLLAFICKSLNVKKILFADSSDQDG
jgi:hypothetical protein